MPGPITPISPSAIASVLTSAAPAPARGFAEALTGLIDAVEQTSGSANTAVGNMLAGTGDVHEAMIALQRAEMSLEFTVQVRNKLVQAYQEIMRMPV